MADVRRALVTTRNVVLTPVNRARIALGLDGSLAVGYWRQKGEQRELEDVQVDGYDERFEELKPILDEMAADLEAHVMPRVCDGGAVLDFGCGTGRYLASFVGLDGVRAVGIDVSEAILDNFTRPKYPSGEFHATDLTADHAFTEQNRGVFDAIFGMSVIQYVRPSRMSVLFGHFAELLRPGGIVYLAFPHPQSRWDEVSNLGYVRYRPEAVERLLESAGLEVAESCAIHYRDRITGIDRSGRPNYGYVVVGRKN